MVLLQHKLLLFLLIAIKIKNINSTSGKTIKISNVRITSGTLLNMPDHDSINPDSSVLINPDSSVTVTVTNNVSLQDMKKSIINYRYSSCESSIVPQL